MGLTDEQLLDFDANRLADFDYDRAVERLARHGDVYRAQLVAARWIDGWRQRAAEQESIAPRRDEQWDAGWDSALREVVAHLRQGDLVPGGVLFEGETTAG